MFAEEMNYGGGGMASGSAMSMAASAGMDDADMDNDNENNLSGAGNLNVSNLVLSVAYNPDFEVTNAAAIDLDTFAAAGFTGLMRIHRLVFLAEHCPSLRLDALRLALTYVMETFNTQLYSAIYKQYSNASSQMFVSISICVCDVVVHRQAYTFER